MQRHHTERGRKTEGERYPTRRLSSTGQVTTGWRSSLETTPGKRFGNFVIELLLAAAVFAALALAIIWLTT